MAIKKKKISEFPLADTLVGLFTVGVDKLNRSVKVSLEFLKTAADKATAAASAATTAAANANTAATTATTAARNADASAASADRAVAALPGQLAEVRGEIEALDQKTLHKGDLLLLDGNGASERLNKK